MHDEALIRQYAAGIAGLLGHGEYVKAHELSSEALSRCAQGDEDPWSRARLTLLAARSAYGVSRFDEALGLCDGAEALVERACIPGADGLPRDGLLFESALVRANVSRRRGDLTGALSLLEPYAGAETPRFAAALVCERFLIEGACRFYLNEAKRAEASLETALGLATAAADSRAQSRVLAMLGLLAQKKGLHKAALEYFERAKDLCRANADHYGEAAAALNAGILLSRRGRLAAAGTLIERARAIFASIGWTIGVCRCLLALGNVAKSRGDLAAAVRSYREAERIAGAGGFARERALACEFIGEVFVEHGRLDVAEARYRECLTLAGAIAPEGDIVAEVERRLGELLLARRDAEGALPVLRHGLRLAQRLGDMLEKGAILRAMARAACALGREQQARALFRRAIDTLRSAGCDFELALTHLAFVDLVVAGGDRADAAGCRPGAGRLGGRESADDLDEALASAVEAGHIFQMAGCETWKKAAGSRLDRVLALRGRRPHAEPVLRSGRHIVKIAFSPDILHYEGFVAVSEAMLRLREQIEFAARFDRPVLVTGETGTGKELVARLIHVMSPRASHPFVALNCAAVPDHLFESEFFGHRRGCFTGAVMDRVGLFEEANRGTLFLDEVGELTTLQQVKLLRALQEGRIRRVGENAERPVNVRVISATNQNLDEKLGNAVMREDFYYRINAEHILVPPLRERREDIVPLMAYRLCGNGHGRRFLRIQHAALKCLQRYAWPGNVRELFAVLERVDHMSNGDVVTLEMLPERIRGGQDAPGAAAARLRGEASVEAAGRLKKALELCSGNKSAAARWLGISRGTLYKELRRSGLIGFINLPPAH
jgi:transcriptional regulator with AAA-type ATPase domain/tetratricopeptide (TPR) repeat protein